MPAKRVITNQECDEKERERIDRNGGKGLAHWEWTCRAESEAGTKPPLRCPLGAVFFFEERQTYALSRRMLDNALDTCEVCPVVLVIAGDIQRRLGRHQDALYYYVQAEEAAPTWAPVFVRKAMSLIATGDYEGAEAACSVAIKVDPVCAPAFFNRGVSRLLQRNRKEAEGDFLEYHGLTGPRGRSMSLLGMGALTL